MSYRPRSMTLCPQTSTSTRSPGCARTARPGGCCAPRTPIALSVLHRVFAKGNARVISAADMEALLTDDEL